MKDEDLMRLAAEAYPRCRGCRETFVSNQRLRRALGAVLDAHCQQHPLEAMSGPYEAARELMRTT